MKNVIHDPLTRYPVSRYPVSRYLLSRHLLNPCLGFVLTALLFTPALGATVVSAGQDLCTHIYLPDDSDIAGIEVTLLVGGTTTAAAHWGGRAPDDPTSRYVGAVPPSDGSWHQLTVDLATGLSAPVGVGDEISEVLWAMHRNGDITEVWSTSCFVEGPAIPPELTLLGPDPLLLRQGGPFVDPGAQCSDDLDDACTATVELGALDLDTVGIYSVSYSATDSHGNSSEILRTVRVESFALGSLTRSIWQGIEGKPITLLTDHAAYPDQPTSTDSITSFQSSPLGNHYGQRVQGYLHPPVTGEYTFWIASDDTGQLWLSSDETAENAAKIAENTRWASTRQWDKYSTQQSMSITLTAGRVYYIEALQKEHTGGDHLSVAWQGPGINRQVIPGSALSPMP